MPALGKYLCVFTLSSYVEVLDQLHLLKNLIYVKVFITVVVTLGDYFFLFQCSAQLKVNFKLNRIMQMKKYLYDLIRNYLFLHFKSETFLFFISYFKIKFA